MGSAGGSDEADDDAAFFNVPVDDSKPTSDSCYVLPENWNTVMAFLTVSTQWRHAGTGATGLDYQGCAVALCASGFKFKAVFAGLQTMEGAVLTILNQRRAGDQ